jgi:hypothetical protein
MTDLCIQRRLIFIHFTCSLDWWKIREGHESNWRYLSVAGTEVFMDQRCEDKSEDLHWSSDKRGLMISWRELRRQFGEHSICWQFSEQTQSAQLCTRDAWNLQNDWCNMSLKIHFLPYHFDLCLKIGYVSAEYEERFRENISTSEKYYWQKWSATLMA